MVTTVLVRSEIGKQGGSQPFTLVALARSALRPGANEG